MDSGDFSLGPHANKCFHIVISDKTVQRLNKYVVSRVFLTLNNVLDNFYNAILLFY